MQLHRKGLARPGKHPCYSISIRKQLPPCLVKGAAPWLDSSNAIPLLAEDWGLDLKSNGSKAELLEIRLIRLARGTLTLVIHGG